MTTIGEVEKSVALGKFFTCPACERKVGCLVDHHWFDEDLKIHFMSICRSCNGVLSTPSDSDSNHELPVWEEQKKRCYSRRLQLLATREFTALWVYSPERLASLIALNKYVKNGAVWLFFHNTFRKEQRQDLKELKRLYYCQILKCKSLANPEYVRIKEEARTKWNLHNYSDFWYWFSDLPNRRDDNSNMCYYWCKTDFQKYKVWRRSLLCDIKKTKDFLMTYTKSLEGLLRMQDERDEERLNRSLKKSCVQYR